MKSLLRQSCLLSIFFIFLSCENDDSSNTTTNFFNLSVGNEWVYKVYHNTPQSESELIFSGRTETVKIVDIVEHQGFTFYKKQTQRTNSNETFSISYSYLRINNSGHLIELEFNSDNIYDYPTEITEETGTVLHPGNDESFIGVIDRFFGSLEFKLYSSENISVEDNNYYVYPYRGILTPSEGFEYLAEKQPEYCYQPNIGLVKSVIYGVAYGYATESRLVSYEVN